jgi:Ser/Thr protein kinase RdoA (MazF antagonist)
MSGVVSERSDSVVRVSGNVVVKQHRAEADLVRSSAVRARHEYDVLAMLGRLLPAEFSVPRVLQLDEADGSLTMERSTGTPLDILMRDSKRTRRALELLTPQMRAAGAWLRTMQEATRSNADGREVLRAQVELAIMHAQGDKRILAGLRELHARVAARPLIVAGHHGDYWPGNVFIDGDRVRVIDFEGYREGLPLEDVAYFLIQLRLLLPRHARLVEPLRAAFLEGYGGIDDQDALTLFTLTKTLHLIARNAGAKHFFLIRIWMRRTLRNIVDGCLQQ